MQHEFNPVNPLAHNNWLTNGCVELVTRTAHGKPSEHVAVCRHHWRRGKSHFCEALGQLAIALRPHR